MTKVRPDFRRILLNLPHSRQDYAAVGLIAEFADLFDVDLVGTYVDDVNLRSLAEIPNVREFRAGYWQPFNSEQFAQDVAFAAREAERLFLENASRHHSRLSFSSAMGADLQGAGIKDIIALIEPNSAIERATHQFMKSLEAAFRSTSSILLVPGHAKQRSGPIIAIASGPDDPGIVVALALASSTKERLILVPSRPSLSLSSVVEKARTAGIATSLAKAAFHEGNLLLPASVKGRLLVMDRKPLMERPAFSQTPTLLVSAELSFRADVTNPKPKSR